MPDGMPTASNRCDLIVAKLACNLLIYRSALATNQKVGCSNHSGRTTDSFPKLSGQFD